MASITGTRIPYSLKGTDWQGSVINETASSRALVAGFTPFGHSPIHTQGNIGFVGQPHEPTTGFYLLGNGYRAYSPTLMRFIAADDFSPFERGGLNAYVYCAADPLNHTDPDGHALLRSLSKLGQRIFSGRKAGDIAHLNEKYEALIGLRNEAEKGLRSIGTKKNIGNEARNAINPNKTGKFGQNPGLTLDEQRDYVLIRTTEQDIFTDPVKQMTAAIKIGRALGRTNARGFTSIRDQEYIFSKGAKAFDKRIARYERKTRYFQMNEKH